MKTLELFELIQDVRQTVTPPHMNEFNQTIAFMLCKLFTVKFAKYLVYMVCAQAEAAHFMVVKCLLFLY